MQIMIDASTCSPAMLRVYAETLIALAVRIEALNVVATGPVTLTPGDAPAAPIVPHVPTPPPPPVDNVLQFPVPPPPSAAAQPAVTVPPAPPAAAHIGIPSNAAATGVATTPTSPSDVPAGTLAFDRTGMPWDARIHSSNRKIKEKEGTWHMRKQVPPETVAAVTAELRARMGAAPAAAMPVIPPAPPAADGYSVPVPPAPPAVPAPPAPDSAVPPPPVAAVGAVPAPPPPAAGPDFITFMTKVNRYAAENRFSIDKLQLIWAEMKVPGSSAVVGKPDLLVWADSILERMIVTGQ